MSRNRRATLPPRTIAVAALTTLAMLGAILQTASATTRDPRAAGGTTRYHRATATSSSLFDIRTDGSMAPSLYMARAQRSLAAELGVQGVVDVDEATGAPRVIARLDGFLTAASDATPSDIALGYVRAQRDAFGLSASDLDGLRLVRDYVDLLGTHHLLWQQVFAGIPMWDNDLRAHVTADGRLVAVTGSPFPGLRVPSTRPQLSATDAIASAYRSVGANVPSLGHSERVTRGPQLRTAFASGEDARLVLFGTGRGARLAWRTTTYVSDTEIDVSIVDDATGEILWRTNLVKADQVGTGLAWEDFPSAGIPGGGGTQQPVTFPVQDGTALSGNNATAFLDTNDDDRPDDDVAASSGLDWNYPAQLDTTDGSNGCSADFPCTWQRGVPFSWQPNAEQNATQVYYFLNRFHDHLLAAPIGFTESAGNFQLANGTGQGSGGDPVVANVLDGANTSETPGLPDDNHRLNANMATLPDGTSPLMQMYLFPSIPQLGTPSSNGGDDASVVYHEYTHGLSNRLITLADGTGAVSSPQSGAMGEAWSDFYAMDFLASQGLEVDGPSADMIVGRYVGGGRPDFIRFEAVDCRVGETSSNCPGGLDTGGRGGFTFGDFGHVYTGPEVHSDGEIWVQTLWDLRTALGSDTTLMLVTRAMELSPPEPSFLDMRNSIIEADQIAFGGSHVAELWGLFAHRGMGFFAVAVDGSDVEPVEDFTTPPVCPGSCGTVSGAVTDSQTGAPLEGFRVAIAGHASGFLSDLADTTDASGAFTIPDVPFHHYVVTVASARHETVARNLIVDGDETVAIHLRRDWASIGGGARVTSFTGPDYTAFGCGPAGAFDASVGTGWGSDTANNDDSGERGPRVVVVRLPKSIDITSFGFASGGTCGDGPEAGVKVFTIRTRSARGRWVTAYERSRALEELVLHTLRPTAGTQNVRFVKIIMRSNYGDPLFMDMLELSVRGRP